MSIYRFLPVGFLHRNCDKFNKYLLSESNHVIKIGRCSFFIYNLIHISLEVAVIANIAHSSLFVGKLSFVYTVHG